MSRKCRNSNSYFQQFVKIFRKIMRNLVFVAFLNLDLF
jgi:hypothetical protein